MNTVSEKAALRKLMHQQRDNLPLSFKQTYDLKIVEQLKTIIKEKDSQNIHLYLPMGSEIDINPLIQELLPTKKTLVAPKTLRNRQLEHLILTDSKAITPGLWGTHYPSSGQVFTNNYDMIIVPGLAFDKNNFRLGYGGGYYDNFLALHPDAFTIGIAYPFQIVQAVPKEIHDFQLDQVLSC